MRNASHFSELPNTVLRLSRAWVICLGLVASGAGAQDDMYDDVSRLLHAGYAPESVFNHQVAAGNAIYRVVDAAVRADPDREAEFRLLALNMLPGLPRSACQGNPHHPVREWDTFEVEDLEPPTIAEVARFFFEENRQLTRLDGSDSHGSFPVSELLELDGQSAYWYQVLPVRNHPVPDAVYVSIYSDGNQVVVDRNLGRLEEARRRGDDTVPVVFHYYQTGTVPAGSFTGEDPGAEIIDAYAADQVTVSPPPNWKSGDFNSIISLEEIESRFDIPEKEDVDSDLWKLIEADIRQNGFSFPLVILLGPDRSELFHSLERVAVARSLGETFLPVTFFYQPPERRAFQSGCARLIAGEEEGRLQGITGFTGNAYRSGNPGGPPAPPVDPTLPPSSPPSPVPPSQPPQPPPLLPPPSVSP